MTLAKGSMITLIAAILAVGLTAGMAAAADLPTTITVKVNDQQIALDVAPVIDQGRTMVPLRGIVEKMGAVVQWDPGAQKVVVTGNGHTVTIQPGSYTAIVDGQEVAQEAAAKVIDGRILVPLRFLSENMDAKVIWVPSTSTVEILSGLTPVQERLYEAFVKSEASSGGHVAMHESIKGSGDPIEIVSDLEADVATNGHDLHVKMGITRQENDAEGLLDEQLAVEIIKKNDQVYERVENSPWEVVGQDALDLPFLSDTSPEEAYLIYYKLPIKMEEQVILNNERTTKFSFSLDKQTDKDLFRSLMQSNPGGKDQTQPRALDDTTTGNVSEEIYTNALNYIIQDNLSTTQTLHAPDGKTLTITTTGTDTYHYGTPESIQTPPGMFTGA